MSVNKWWTAEDLADPQGRHNWYAPTGPAGVWQPDTFLVGGEDCDGCPRLFAAGESFLLFYREDGDPHQPESYCLDCAATVQRLGRVPRYRPQRPPVDYTDNVFAPVLATGTPRHSLAEIQQRLGLRE